LEQKHYVNNIRIVRYILEWRRSVGGGGARHAGRRGAEVEVDQRQENDVGEDEASMGVATAPSPV